MMALQEKDPAIAQLNANISYYDKRLNRMGFLESNSILTQYKKYSISHLQNPTSKLNNPALVKLKPNYILRFNEDILSIEYLTASLFIIAL